MGEEEVIILKVSKKSTGREIPVPLLRPNTVMRNNEPLPLPLPLPPPNWWHSLLPYVIAGVTLMSAAAVAAGLYFSATRVPVDELLVQIKEGRKEGVTASGDELLEQFKKGRESWIAAGCPAQITIHPRFGLR